MRRRNMGAIGRKATKRAVGHIETDHVVFNLTFKELLVGFACMLCLVIFFLVNMGMSQQQQKLEHLDAHQQQKLEQLKEQQQQKLDAVEEKLAETSSNFTARLVTISIGLLLLILLLFHLVGILKVESADRERAQQQVNGQQSGRIDGMERDWEAERADNRAQAREEQRRVLEAEQRAREREEQRSREAGQHTREEQKRAQEAEQRAQERGQDRKDDDDLEKIVGIAKVIGTIASLISAFA